MEIEKRNNIKYIEAARRRFDTLGSVPYIIRGEQLVLLVNFVHSSLIVFFFVFCFLFYVTATPGLLV